VRVTKEDITPEFIRENEDKIVWLQDDYLSMRGYALIEPADPALYDFLEHIVKVKKSMRIPAFVTADYNELELLEWAGAVPSERKLTCKR
jgi:hypothetical protein